MAGVPHLTFGGSAGVAISTGQTRFLFVCSGSTADLASTESQRQIKWRTAGTLSNISIVVVTNTATFTSTLRSRINGANGNQSASIAAGATGQFEDTSNTDPIAAGDNVCLSLVGAGGGSGTLTYSTHGTVFSATSDTCVRFVNDKSNNLVDGGFYAPVGETGSGTEASTQHLARTAGTLKNAAVSIFSNSRNGAVTVRTRINGSNGNVSVSITASTTGLFEDTSNTDTLADGDVWCWTSTFGGTTGTLASGYKAIDYVTTNSQGMIYGDPTFSGGLTAGLTRYIPVSGEIVAVNATESNVSCHILAAKTVSRLHCRVNTNNLNASATLILNINGSSGNNSVSIPSSTTGRFEDTTHTDALNASDVVSVKCVLGGSSGGITLNSYGLLFGNYGAAAGGGTFNVLLVSP